MSISVLILTYNEENIIEECIKSVLWSDDIVVFDSYSTDSTVEIVKRYNARVLYRVFDNEKAHREESLKIKFKNEWVYNPDADEITTIELRDEMKKVVSLSDNENSAYKVRFKVIYQQKWMRYSSQYPVWVYRLFKPKRIRFDREINLEYITDGHVGMLTGHFLHYTFNKGVSHWIDKHNKYSSAEALESIKSLSFRRVIISDLISRDVCVRRKALKELSFRLPFRYFLKFIYIYIFRGGVMDGLPGLRYCILQMIYEYFIVIKIKEIRMESGEKDIVP
jgi:glycosyltransferase involved in cell wall biosynthesis